MTLIDEQEWNRGIELRRKYDEEFLPLFFSEDYGAAFKYLLFNHEIKDYLKPSEIRAMYDFLEVMCTDLAIMANDPHISKEEMKEKLKGLEGKVKQIDSDFVEFE